MLIPIANALEQAGDLHCGTPKAPKCAGEILQDLFAGWVIYCLLRSLEYEFLHKQLCLLIITTFKSTFKYQDAAYTESVAYSNRLALQALAMVIEVD